MEDKACLISDEPTRRKWKKPTTRSLDEYLTARKNVQKVTPKNTPPQQSAKNLPIKRPDSSKKQAAKHEKPTPIKKKLENFRESNGGRLQEPPSILLPSEEELNKAVILLIRMLKKFQDRLWKKSQEKARAHRRLVFGFHETLKRVRAQDVKIVIFARNIDKEMEQESITGLLLELQTECAIRSIPLIRAATKLELSKASSKFPYTNAIGILDTSGAEDQAQEVVKRNEQAIIEKEFLQYQSSLFA